MIENTGGNEMNSVSLLGRLCREIEVRQTPNGTRVISNTIAVDGVGDHTDFIPVVFWGQTAEFVGKYFRKGSRIAVTGRIQSREYEDKQGNRRTAIEVNVQRAYFCESKSRGTDATVEYTGLGDPDSDFEEIGDEDGDLPF